jgi:hypothetical protein
LSVLEPRDRPDFGSSNLFFIYNAFVRVTVKHDMVFLLQYSENIARSINLVDNCPKPKKKYLPRYAPTYVAT